MNGTRSGSWAREQGYDARELVASGLDQNEGRRSNIKPQSSKLYDRFRGRIMFPICNDVGEVIAFSGRVAERRGRRGEISELTGDAAFPKGQRPFWPAQIQAGPDRSELRDCVRRPARFDQLVRSRDHECRRAAGDGVHRKSGAYPEAFRE